MKKLEKNESEIYREKEIPSLWKWYFSWNFRSLITIPLFLFFIYHGIYFIFVEIQDILLFFQTPVTWGTLLLIIFAGIFMIWIILAPIYIYLLRQLIGCIKLMSETILKEIKY